MSKAAPNYANYTYFCGVLWCSRRTKCLFQLQLPLSVEGWKQSSAVLSLTQQYTTRAAALYFVPFESTLNKGPYYKNTYPHVWQCDITRQHFQFCKKPTRQTFNVGAWSSSQVLKFFPGFWSFYPFYPSWNTMYTSVHPISTTDSLF